MSWVFEATVPPAAAVRFTNVLPEVIASFTEANGAAGAHIGANIVAVPEGRRMTLTAANAGLLARGLFAFESMRDGTLDASVVLPGRATDTTDPKVPDLPAPSR